MAGRWQRRTPWLADLRLRLDALHQLWRQRILRFDQRSQEKLLLLLRIPEPDGQKLVMVLAAGLGMALAWLTWRVRRELEPPTKDSLRRAYDRLCGKLAAVGLPRSAHEGAEDYAARIAQLRPDLAAAVSGLCRRYSQLRYGADPQSTSVPDFVSAVREFHPQPLGSRPWGSRRAHRSA